jgi:hypothetical protein
MIHKAELNERTCMELAGMQYAETGNPYIGLPTNAGYYYYSNSANQNVNASWSTSGSVAENFIAARYGKQYIYLDSKDFTISGKPYLRGSVANSYASGGNRESAGISAYRQRTLLGFEPAAFLTAEGNYGNCTTLLWFDKPAVGELQRMNVNADNPYFFNYDLVASEYWFTQEGRNYGVFHNLKLNNATESVGQLDTNRHANSSITEGWFVYEYRSDGKWYRYN